MALPPRCEPELWRRVAPLPSRRRRVLRWFGGAATLVVIGLVFRRAVAAIVVAALGATLHLVGLDLHLPTVRFGWPWQPLGHTRTSTESVGPWVLQRIERIGAPALGTSTFGFTFTHRVSKSIGPWPADVTIDDVASKPIATDHSWTYPGLGCGVLLKPQFPPSVLYAEAQRIAYRKATTSTQVTAPLLAAARSEATTMIRDDFVQPTVNALGYQLRDLTLHWTAG